MTRDFRFRSISEIFRVRMASSADRRSSGCSAEIMKKIREQVSNAHVFPLTDYRVPNGVKPITPSSAK